MGKLTQRQRLLRQGQPYTVIHPVIIRDALGGEEHLFQVLGHTLEDRLKDEESGEWIKRWETHDLGAVASLRDADEVAREWRSSLAGVYEL